MQFRLHLFFAVVTALLLVVTLRSTERRHYTFAKIQAEAEQMAQKPFVAPSEALPPQLKKLTPAQEQSIFWKYTYRLWRKKGLPFQVDFYHRSNKWPASPTINTVDQNGAHFLAYSPTFFDFPNLNIEPPLPANVGYAGFYLRYPINKPNSLDGFFSALGASYFRVLAKDQVYGLSARALAINAGLDYSPEEFPEFKEWWLHQPAPDANEVVLDALLDSPSVTGAYGFKIHPGSVTSVDIHATLFFRKPVALLGIAPFSSMYLYGENAPNHFGNFHPEIHDSDGLLINTGQGDWMWRPLGQAPLVQIYKFADENPKGFGLLQRDRDFQHYQDLDLKYNVRPSAWVIPHGNWGKGSIVLIHRPSSDPSTDNVVLFWHPEQTPKSGDRLDFDYTIDFYMNDALRPPLAYSNQTLIVCPAPPPVAPPGLPAPPSASLSPSTAKTHNTIPVQFLVNFTGNGLENLPAAQPPRLYLHFEPPETQVRESKVEKIDYDKSWRVSFTIIPFKHDVQTELHCRLLQNDDPTANAKPLSEDWTYTWHQ